MFTFQTNEVITLRNFIRPLLHVSEFADISCDASRISLIVKHENRPSRFTAALQMFDTFFTCMTYEGDYHSRIPIKDFFNIINQMADQVRFLTFLLPEAHSVANVIFTNLDGSLRCVTPLMLFPPENQDAEDFDDKEVYVAIEAEKFREMARQFSPHNAKIFATATPSQVKFSVETAGGLNEIVLTVEQRECMVGGRLFGNGIQFSFGINPLEFFLSASHLTELVWFCRSDDLCTVITFLTGEWNPIVVYYPEDYVEQLNPLFAAASPQISY